MSRTLTFATLTVAATVFAIVVACAGCRGGGPSYSFGASPDGGGADPLQQLEEDTGHSWSVRWRQELHTPAMLEGRTAPLATTGDDAERAGRAFLLKYGALYAMKPGDDLVATDSGTDELGMTHARFSQHAGDVPVWGGELIAHFDTDGSLIRVNGRYVPIAVNLPDPVKTSDEARALAASAARTAHPNVTADGFTTEAPKLYAYPIGTTTVKLVWRVAVDASDDAEVLQLEAFVDAVDGSIVHMAETTAYADGSGIGVTGDVEPLVIAKDGASFILEDATRGSPASRTYSSSGSTRLPGTAVRSKDPMAWDTGGAAAGAAVDAHAFVARTWDYFAKVHGRKGWDGKNKGIHATVHYCERLRQRLLRRQPARVRRR